MEWVQSKFLWALLGIGVPILIHLWNGRKGKVIAWAASAWLNPKESQSNRSLQIQEWWLLLLRIVLWVLLVLLVAGIWWEGKNQVMGNEIVHLVIPGQDLESEFRFELEQASERGEDVFWLADGLPELEGNSPEIELENLQSYLDELSEELDSVHLYLPSVSNKFPRESLWLPQVPTIHLSENKAFIGVGKSITLDSAGYLTLSQEGVLQIREEKGNTQIVLESPLKVYLSPSVEKEKESILAALNAIEEVYHLAYEESDSTQAGLIFSNSMENQSSPWVLATSLEDNGKGKLQLISGASGLSYDELVEKGILPEMILERILENTSIENPIEITQSQWARKFQKIPDFGKAKEAKSSEIILILLVLVFISERYLAYQKNL
ncbi:BatA domain-containing protein [Algoriphagus zhangzhouensis]|uniref:N-terminal double-transmembrane domain-containing protein n=1 Tax=Algoriphagus zhangzhouensis TaxID=1073327 RepID=A0A1M7Z712_9BACT|nr:BatA domain-containing protein [Algoriphagus zhangzhouensis]TDY49249.1 putative membrane protein (TIGR02226 family) [Algoriphagus zhangzhouensis]SHO60659.1 N-terminal double-transmembrane domain-containing protein [Algoriphagus zhangzhouensis]